MFSSHAWEKLPDPWSDAFCAMIRLISTTLYEVDSIIVLTFHKEKLSAEPLCNLLGARPKVAELRFEPRKPGPRILTPNNYSKLPLLCCTTGESCILRPPPLLPHLWTSGLCHAFILTSLLPSINLTINHFLASVLCDLGYVT